MVMSKEVEAAKCEPCLVESVGEVRVISAIVQWEGEPGTDPHCVVRVYVKDGRAIGLISEVRGNMRNHDGINFKEASLANIVVASLGDEIGVAPSRITWFCHYGNFSHFEWRESRDWPDEFTKENLVWQGDKYTKEGGEVSLIGSDFFDALGVEWAGLEIESPIDVLQKLGWRTK
jgi:hypothetical protein